MWATVIPKFTAPNQNIDTRVAGTYQRVQDADSGEVRMKFVPDPSVTDPQVSSRFEIKCYARAYTALGYRSSANRESIVQQDYQAVESIQFDYPKSVLLNRQALITNIRGHESLDDWFWLNEDTGNPIVWEVQGVSPVHDPFGKHIRNTTVLKRAEVQ